MANKTNWKKISAWAWKAYLSGAVPIMDIKCSRHKCNLTKKGCIHSEQERRICLNISNAMTALLKVFEGANAIIEKGKALKK